MRALTALLALALLCAVDAKSGIKANLPKSLGSVNRAEGYAKMAALPHKLTETHRALATKPRTMGALECYNAVVELLTIIDADHCGPLITAQFDYANTAGRSEAQIEADTVTYCEAGCHANLTTILNAAASSCVAEDVGSETADGLRNLLALTEIPCIQRDDVYCTPSFFAMAAADDGTDYVTDEELEATCDPCLADMIRAYTVFSTDTDTVAFSLYLNLICLQDTAGEYCWPKARDAFAEETPEDQEELEPEELEAICDPCVRSVVYALANIELYYPGAIDDFDPTAVATLELLCARDTDNELCLNMFIAELTAAPASTSCPDWHDDTVPETCEEACVEWVASLVENMGCCAYLIDDYLWISADSDEEANTDFIEFFTDECAAGAETLAVCPLPTVNGVVYLSNIVYSYYTANDASMLVAIKTDIALAAGVEYASITVVSVLQDGTGDTIIITFTIEVVSNTDNDQVFTKISSDISFPTVNAEADFATSHASYAQALTVNHAAGKTTFSKTVASYGEGSTGGGGDDDMGNPGARASVGVAGLLVGAVAVAFRF